jgi:hypothetical protein
VGWVGRSLSAFVCSELFRLRCDVKEVNWFTRRRVGCRDRNGGQAGRSRGELSFMDCGRHAFEENGDIEVKSRKGGRAGWCLEEGHPKRRKEV